MGDVDDWVQRALANDAMVAELLVSLRLGQQQEKIERSLALAPLKWKVRQPRSKPVIQTNKQSSVPRASPTTPLSWSGATANSASGAADGFEESSGPHPKLAEASGSKVSLTSGITAKKRSRKRKSLAELQEEEALLLKERKKLTMELAAVRINLESQRATNERLKIMKLDFESQRALERVTVATPAEAVHCQTQEKVPSCDSISSLLQVDAGAGRFEAAQLPALNLSSKADRDDKFVLPDLNLPMEEGN
ncbi:hypothetical protein NMG60_11004840 [Bertholletia excelsa]